MIIFAGEGFIVENRLFTGWRVTDTRLRQRVRPDRALAVRVSRAWHAIRTNRRLEPDLRRRAEDHLMLELAVVTTEPDGPERDWFLAGTPHDLAEKMIGRAMID